MVFRRVLLLLALVLAGLAAGWAAAADRDQRSEPDLGPVVVVRGTDPTTPTSNDPAGGAIPVQPHAPAQAGEDDDPDDAGEPDDPDDGDG